MELRNYFNANFWTKASRSKIKDAIQKKLEVSKGTVSNWLSGRTSPPEYARIIIANIMGVSVAELFPNTENCSA